MAVELNRSVLRSEITREAVKKGGLARAIGPDESDDLSLAYGKTDVIHRGQAAKFHGQVFHIENFHTMIFLSCEGILPAPGADKRK